LHSRFALAALLVALVSGCGGGDGTTGPSSREGTSAIGPAGDGSTAGRVYFTAGEQLAPIRSGARNPSEAARELLKGPAAHAPRDASTQIPGDTALRGVSVDDGTATVRVSRAFMTGIPADPEKRSGRQRADLDARLAQVTYTLTDLEDVDRARVVSGGVGIGPARDRDDFAKPMPKAPKDRRGDPKPKGRASAGVRGVQKRLARLRYLPKGAVDGIDGYRTQQAVMAFQAWEGLQRDGIVGPQTRAALTTARRPRPKADGPSRRLEVHRDKGVTLIVKHGRTKRAIHTSSGAPGYTTPSGRFEVFRKEVNSWSVPYQTWLPWASYFNAGIAFHAYPDVPAYPASHGCVRVPEPEAEHLYAFARIGTAVVVR